jgi:hypothetical protein
MQQLEYTKAGPLDGVFDLKDAHGFFPGPGAGKLNDASYIPPSRISDMSREMPYKTLSSPSIRRTQVELPPEAGREKLEPKSKHSSQTGLPAQNLIPTEQSISRRQWDEQQDEYIRQATSAAKDPRALSPPVYQTPMQGKTVEQYQQIQQAQQAGLTQAQLAQLTGLRQAQLAQLAQLTGLTQAQVTAQAGLTQAQLVQLVRQAKHDREELEQLCYQAIQAHKDALREPQYLGAMELAEKALSRAGQAYQRYAKEAKRYCDYNDQLRALEIYNRMRLLTGSLWRPLK